MKILNIVTICTHLLCFSTITFGFNIFFKRPLNLFEKYVTIFIVDKCIENVSHF